MRKANFFPIFFKHTFTDKDSPFYFIPCEEAGQRMLEIISQLYKRTKVIANRFMVGHNNFLNDRKPAFGKLLNLTW